MENNSGTEPIYNELGNRICGAACKQRPGELCQRPPVKGRNRCHFHGGRTPIGVASGTHKHGMLSKYVPARMLGVFQEAVNQPELLSVRGDIALLTVRLTELMSRLDREGSGSAWEDLSELWADFKQRSVDAQRAKQEGDADGAAKIQQGIHETLQRVDKLIAAGIRNDETWREMVDLIERTASLKQAEVKLAIQANAMLTTEQALLLFAKMLEAVRECVRDTAALTEIQLRFQKLAELTVPGAVVRGALAGGQNAPRGGG